LTGFPRGTTLHVFDPEKEEDRAVTTESIDNPRVLNELGETHMHSRKTILALSLILTIAAMVPSSATVFAAKPPPQNPTTVDLHLAPTTPPCAGMTEVTGIYQDGNGIYLPNEGVGFNSGGDLNMGPLCSENRQINALLPAAALAQLTGPMGSCPEIGKILLKIPDLLNAQSGPLGLPHPPNPVWESVHYYFVVDTNGDGRFGLPRDDAYNLVWQSGIWLNRTEYVDRTVYELTTDMTSHNAELFRGATESKGTFCVPLQLTVTRMK
jgi:hypothetical protein